MNLTRAHALIREIGVSVFSTSDVAAKLNISTSYASKILRRLANHGFLYPLLRGSWALSDINDPFAVLEQITAPLPAYISLQTALYHHGMISQIPNVIYAVSLTTTRRVKTPLGTFSIHHISPSFFFGFQSYAPHGIKMACPEKALLDIVYLRQNMPKLFSRLPELEIPNSFSFETCQNLISKLTSKRRKSTLERGIRELRNELLLQGESI